MDEKQLWDAFTQTGAVEDYLRYRQAQNAVMPTQGKDGASRDTQNRRADCAGK